MNRRPLVLLALVIASFVAAACSETTAPRRDGEITGDSTAYCRSGVYTGSGRCA